MLNFLSLAKKMLLKKILFYAAIAITLAGICYLAWLNHDDFKKTMIKQSQTQLLIIAESQAQSIEKYIVDVHRELEILSSEFAIHRRILEENNKAVKAEYNAYLENSYKDIEKIVDSIYLIDSKGIVIDISPFKEGIIGENISQMPVVKQALAGHQPDTNSVFRTPSGILAIANLYPILENGKYIGLLRADILINRVNQLVNHINRGDERFVFVIDGNAKLISYRKRNYLGKNIETLWNGKPEKFEVSGLKSIINEMVSGREGIGIFLLPPLNFMAKTKKTLIGFAPIHIGTNIWSIGVAMDYETISGPVNRNIRDNLVFTGFVLFIFLSLGVSFYRMQKRKDELAISRTVSNIINKQLHLEIAERKKIEEELRNSLGFKKVN